MKIDMKDIFEFFELRIKSHITAVNYFAELLGYHFPEHDCNKIIEPIRTGYAYIFYQTYHKNFHPTAEHLALYKEAQDIHHSHTPHHIQYYKHVSEIPDIYLYEMVADWASANFEQKNIIKCTDTKSIEQWFQENMAQFDWAPNQLEIIKKSFDIIKKNTNAEYVKTIWQPLLEKSDL